MQLMEHAVIRRTQHALAREAADQPRNIRVRNGRAAADHAPERVPAHRLDHRVAVLTRREPRPQRNHERRIIDLRPKIFLRQNRVHQHIGPQSMAAFRRRIGQDGDVPRRQNPPHIVHCLCAHRGHIFHFCFAK